MLSKICIRLYRLQNSDKKINPLKKKHWSQANRSVQSLKLVSKTQKYFVPASVIKGWFTTVPRKIKEIIVDPQLNVRWNSQILVQAPLEACVFRSVSFFIWFFYHGLSFRCCSVVPTVINRVLEKKLCNIQIMHSHIQIHTCSDIYTQNGGKDRKRDK